MTETSSKFGQEAGAARTTRRISIGPLGAQHTRTMCELTTDFRPDYVGIPSGTPGRSENVSLHPTWISATFARILAAEIDGSPPFRMEVRLFHCPEPGDRLTFECRIDRPTDGCGSCAVTCTVTDGRRRRVARCSAEFLPAGSI